LGLIEKRGECLDGGIGFAFGQQQASFQQGRLGRIGSSEGFRRRHGCPGGFGITQVEQNFGLAELCLSGGGGIRIAAQGAKGEQGGVGLVKGKLEGRAGEEGFFAIRGLGVIKSLGKGVNSFSEATTGREGLGFPEVGFWVSGHQRLEQEFECLSGVAATNPRFGEAHGNAVFLGGGQGRILQELLKAEGGDFP